MIVIHPIRRIVLKQYIAVMHIKSYEPYQIEDIQCHCMALCEPMSTQTGQNSYFSIIQLAPFTRHAWSSSSLSLWGSIEKSDQVLNIMVYPTLLLYSDTVSRSAIFCGVATTIERCKTEGVVDVFQVVKAMRVQKPGAIQTVVCV